MTRVSRARARSSAWDRIGFGIISATAGTLLGLGAAFVAGLSIGQAPSYGPIAWFSAFYFGVIGVLRGPDAGFLAGEVLRVIWAGAQAEGGRPHPSERPEQRDQPPAWHSAGLLLAWIAVVVILAWRT